MAEMYVEDKRDAYINAVDFLHDILLPHFDKTMNNESEAIQQDLEEAQRSFIQEKKLMSDWIDYKLIIKRKLFQKISLQLKRLNYLEQKTRAE